MLSRLFRKRHAKLDFPPPAPDGVVEVVGDIHGCIHLLEALEPVGEGATRVLVGDYVDRGPDSRAVLERVFRHATEDGWIALMGNHEQMFLDFLNEPAKGRRWLRYGGLQTLASFGVGGLSETAGEAALREAARKAHEILPEGLKEWLQALPKTWSSGTLSVVHAALDPQLPIEAQATEVALWGHPEFGKVVRTDGQWVAHGHTIMDAPTIRNGVISVDTGAYATGVLTLARVSPGGEIAFDQARPQRR